MLAVDTNILVRYISNDHAEQAARARRLIDDEEIFVPITVLIETAWVLRRAFGFDRSAIAAALQSFAGLPNVALEEPELARRALDWTEQGLDFADAVHLAKAAKCEAFVSFDRQMAARARRVGSILVRAP